MNQTIRLSKDGELFIPEEVQAFFPKGQLVRISSDSDGRIIIKSIPHLRLCDTEIVEDQIASVSQAV